MEFKLRKFKKGDEESLRKSIDDKEIAKNTLTVPSPYSLKDAKFWISHNLELYKKKKSESLNLAVDIDGKVAGGVGLCHIDRQSKNAEIGYWLAREYWGRGLMTKIVKEMVRYSFKKLQLVRVYGYVFPFNKASARVLEKAGFQYEGTLRKRSIKNGKYLDDMVYAIVR